MGKMFEDTIINCSYSISLFFKSHILIRNEMVLSRLINIMDYNMHSVKLLLNLIKY